MSIEDQFLIGINALETKVYKSLEKFFSFAHNSLSQGNQVCLQDLLRHELESLKETNLGVILNDLRLDQEKTLRLLVSLSLLSELAQIVGLTLIKEVCKQEELHFYALLGGRSLGDFSVEIWGKALACKAKVLNVFKDSGLQANLTVELGVLSRLACELLNELSHPFSEDVIGDKVSDWEYFKESVLIDLRQLQLSEEVHRYLKDFIN